MTVFESSIEDNKSEEETVTLISKELEVDEETAKREVAAFISQLKESGIVK